VSVGLRDQKKITPLRPDVRILVRLVPPLARGFPAPMISSRQRKTVLILSLALSLAVALIAITAQEDLREKLGSVFYVIGFAIIGCVLLVLAGYVWDRSLMERLKTLREAGTPSEKRTPPTREESDPDEILGLARNIGAWPAPSSRSRPTTATWSRTRST
jgi:hypothetical protein